MIERDCMGRRSVGRSVDRWEIDTAMTNCLAEVGEEEGRSWSYRDKRVDRPTATVRDPPAAIDSGWSKLNPPNAAGLLHARFDHAMLAAIEQSVLAWIEEGVDL